MKYCKYCLIFFIHLLISIFFLYKISNFTLNWIDHYTHHGSYVKVPNIRYFYLNKAIFILKKLGLKYEIDYSHYNPSLNSYQIISFFPETGDHVKIGRSIYIQVNSKKKIKTTVLPNIINKNKNLAIQLLKDHSIMIKYIKYINHLSKDKILKIFYKKKSISSGSIIPYKDGITLIIGNGYLNNKVPNVIGMSLSNATYILKKKLFNIINFYYDNPLNTNDNQNTIYRQNPLPGKIIKIKNKSIDLWVTSNKKKEKLLNNLIEIDESNLYETKKTKEQKINNEINTINFHQ